MSEGRVERRLAAILAADVVGYSRLMGQDEAGTLARLQALRRDLIDPKVADHKGRIVKTTGDGILIEFPSVVEAVACAATVQRELAQYNLAILPDQRIEFRVGVNLGDVIVDGDDIHGDGVNIAARLEGLAEPGGICISARVHEDVAGKVEAAFEDIGKPGLKNIGRPVRVYRVRLGTTTKASATAPPLTLPDKPSIAVLPFQNMSGDSEQEYFADGMVDEIITALSCIRSLFVIARNSSFTYKGQHVDIKQVGRELGVRYVLEGAVRKSGNRVRITTQLIEAENGTHLWADRFDGSLEDVFELQDVVASRVAGVIEPAVQAAEIRRATDRPTSNLTAYDLYLRALPLRLSIEMPYLERSLDLLERAIELDPGYGLALVNAAQCHFTLVFQGWANDPETARRTGLRLAREAVHAAPDDPSVLALAAQILAYFGEDISTSVGLIERALALNPNHALAFLSGAWVNLWAGDAEAAVEFFNRFRRLSPRDRNGISLCGIGMAQFFDRRFVDAAATLRATLQEIPTQAAAHRFLISCYAHMGQLERAREVLRQLREISPNAVWTDARFFRNDEHRNLLLSGLRLAGAECRDN